MSLLLAGGLMMSGTAWARQTPVVVPVTIDGVTHISAGAVTVDLTTRRATSAENAPGRATRCTRGWTNCSLVDTLSIRIGGRNVLIPDRLPLLLSDVSTASVVGTGPNRYRLTLAGGDAAAAYEARIDFDRHMVRRMEIRSGEMQATEQVTDYRDLANEPAN